MLKPFLRTMFAALGLSKMAATMYRMIPFSLTKLGGIFGGKLKANGNSYTPGANNSFSASAEK